MKDSDIRKYAELMQELGLTAIEVKNGDDSVRLERGAAAVQGVMYPAPEERGEKGAKDTGEDGAVVKSPIVGVFYASSAENAPPYVSVGDKVKKGQVLCIIEAMKLMNEICAEESGEISEIFVTNGQVVEYGTPLFKIKK